MMRQGHNARYHVNFEQGTVKEKFDGISKGEENTSVFFYFWLLIFFLICTYFDCGNYAIMGRYYE